MTDKQIRQLSRFLSKVLRHSPEIIKIELDKNGWANVSELIKKVNKHKLKFNFETLEHIVATNNKKRFAFNEDKTKIRANQGHSIQIAHGVIAIEPPCAP